MAVDVIETTDRSWSSALEGLRHDIYHLPEYLRLEAERTRDEGRAFVIDDGGKRFFLPFLVRSCDGLGADAPSGAIDVASPYGYPGMLFNENALGSPDFVEDAFHELYQAMRSLGACTAFFRLHPILSHFPDKVALPGLSVLKTSTVSVDLTLSESQIWARTRKGHQSTINKTTRLGYTARMVDFHDYEDAFISIYEETMARVGGAEFYYFSKDYFANLAKLGDRFWLCIVEKDGEIAAACILFECNGIVQAHLGGTRGAFMKDSPFSQLLHYARLWAKARGNEFVHLGGGVGGTKDPVYCYKSGFSRQRHDLLTLQLVLDEAKYRDLVAARAEKLGVTPDLLLQSKFFPAYRATN